MQNSYLCLLDSRRDTRRNCSIFLAHKISSSFSIEGTPLFQPILSLYWVVCQGLLENQQPYCLQTKLNIGRWASSLTLRLLMSYMYMEHPFLMFLHYTHNDAAQSVGLLWTSDQLVAETSYLTTLTTDKYLYPRWDSNPQTQQASGRTPTP